MTASIAGDRLRGAKKGLEAWTNRLYAAQLLPSHNVRKIQQAEAAVRAWAQEVKDAEGMTADRPGLPDIEVLRAEARDLVATDPDTLPDTLVFAQYDPSGMRDVKLMFEHWADQERKRCRLAVGFARNKDPVYLKGVADG